VVAIIWVVHAFFWFKQLVVRSRRRAARMPSFRPPEPRPPRLTGIANMFRALRNLGMFGGPVGHDELEHFVADDGQSVPVAVVGNGPPVVLVHGLGCWHRHWMPVARRLARSHSVYVWDARGHGQSRPLPGIPITLKRLADDLRQLLDHFGLDRATLVGHSMGALTVMQYLHDHGTARVAGVGVVDQSPRIVTDDEWRLGLFGGCSAAMLEGLIAGARKDLAETVLHEIEAKANWDWVRARLAPDATLGAWLRRWLHRIDATSLLDLAESLAVADFRASLRRLDAPLMVVLGKHSPHYAEVPLEDWYRSAVPHATVTVYERAGHSPHFTEPARFASELKRFIADHA
jgi:non-heme chloroperoxidase